MIKKTAKEYALFLLGKRDYTEFKLGEKLKQKEFSIESILETILWLKDKNFLDDQRFTRNFIKSHGAEGKFKIKQKLMQRGVSQDTISSNFGVITSEEEQEKALILAKKWLGKNQDKENKYQKLGSHLISKGFEYDIVKEVLAKTIE